MLSYFLLVYLKCTIKITICLQFTLHYLSWYGDYSYNRSTKRQSRRNRQLEFYGKFRDSLVPQQDLCLRETKDYEEGVGNA